MITKHNFFDVAKYGVYLKKWFLKNFLVSCEGT